MLVLPYCVNKDAIAVLVLGLLLTWLLTSSVGMVKFQVNANSQSGNFHGLSLPTLPLPSLNPGFPIINITVAPSINFSIVGIFTVPLVPMPIILPNISIIQLSPGIPIIKVSSVNVAGTSSSTTGKSQGFNSNSNVLLPIQFPKILIIALLIITLIITVIMGVMSTRNLLSIRRDIKAKSPPQSKQLTELRIRKAGSKSQGVQNPIQYYDSIINLMPHELIAPIQGWGGSSLIKFPIPEDLPLIWHVGSMPIETSEGVSITINPQANIINNSIQFPNPGCYELEVKRGDVHERWFIRVINYNEDVVKLMRLNNTSASASSTVREDLLKSLSRDNYTIDLIMKILNVFERARYGLKTVGRDEYEDYLRALAKVFPNAKVIVCG